MGTTITFDTAALVDAFTFKGVIDASTNPNYPAANAGDTYKISVAGKVGGASGAVVEAGDTIYATVDESAAGTQAAVGANWVITQGNIDGAVTGPASSVTTDIATFNGVTGKVIQDSGKSFTTDVTLAANSDALVPTEKAVKAYVDASPAGTGDVTGPAVAVSGDVATYSGVSGKLIADSGKSFSIDGTLAGNSDALIASQKAVKTYADTKQPALGFTAENVANKDIDGTLAANSDTKYASQKAVKTYADALAAAALTLSNKRLTPRVLTIVSSGTPTINTDLYDAVSITALAVDITSFTTNLTGTPVNFDKLIIRIADTGSIRAITHGAKFAAGAVALPTATIAGKVLSTLYMYDTVTTLWHSMASGSRP